MYFSSKKLCRKLALLVANARNRKYPTFGGFFCLLRGNRFFDLIICFLLLSVTFFLFQVPFALLY